MKQLKLFSEKRCAEFGGTLNVGRRKVMRPLNPRLPIHLVLKAEEDQVLLLHRNLIHDVISKYSARFNVKIYGLGIEADHVHLALWVCDREDYCRWIRAVTAQLVRRTKGLKWSQPAYSRVVSLGLDLQNVCKYVEKNAREGELLLKAHKRVETFRRGFWNS